MAEPDMPQKEPYVIEVEEGRSYLWCRCGKSANQPFCDSSHKATEFLPIRYKAEKSGTVYFCGCKRSGAAPLCDDTHETL